MSDHNTAALLQEMGIHVLSDTVQIGAIGPHRSDGPLALLPISVWTDHEHIYHAERTPEHVAGQLSRSKIDLSSVSVAEWTELVKQQVIDIIRRGGTATLLVHPVCMKIADDFQSFTSLCEFLSDFESIWARDCLGSIPSEVISR